MAEDHKSMRSDKRVMLLGATGTIGQAVVRAFVDRGHDVVCVIRPPSNDDGRRLDAPALDGVDIRIGDVLDPDWLQREGFRGERFEVLVSCLASRTGAPKDAWAIDYQAHSDALNVAKQAGVTQMVLVSAICVQKPKLAFQKAKIAFEKELIESGLRYSIVRPTAFFKSLSGQIERVKAGKPYLIFGSGELTACKPISDNDLAAYIADCVDDDSRHNRILPIGGPGDAVTPRQQGERLFTVLGAAPRFRSVPPAMLIAVARVLSTLARLYPPLAAKAEYARIAHYYATESMLVFDAESGQYSADLTPSTGAETLFEHYDRLVNR